MCLTTKYREPKIASCDIECFKVLSRGFNGDLFTPFYRVRTSLGEALAAKDNEEYPIKGIDHYVVTCEGVHAFVTKSAAKVVAMRRYDGGLVNRVIAEATIQAGTEYWRSVDGKEIAARRMIINRIIN